jgi:NAD(P)H dehydrogenase (quinone)
MNMANGDQRHRILILGASGQIGSAVVSALETGSERPVVVRASRNRDQVDAWKHAGFEAVYLDLDDARTFAAALQGVDRLFLLTGYTIAMVHQSKTIIDAAADAGVRFIVHLGVFGNGRSTDPHFAWHEMIERYIEGSGVAWCHLHPHFFMENLITTLRFQNGRFFWPMGDKRIGWIAGEDVSAVAARILADGPANHQGQNYWLSTDVLNGAEAATILSEALNTRTEAAVMTPAELMALLASGAAAPISTMESNYARSAIEWVHQTYDGRMDYSSRATSTVQDLLGRPATHLHEWAARHRSTLMQAASG